MNNFLNELKSRMRQTKPTRWVRFGVVSLIFFAWVAWLGNWWVAFWWLLLLDIYITGFIPFTWWKRSKSPIVRTLMSWVDAIVYAIVVVYFVFTYVGQNYSIPSSSLEKTLLTGDYLWVNKMAYGPRVPMTPIHFPLVQNTLPILNTKSYVEHPQWTYHRLKGFGSVQLGDIVVFNFPAGDSIALKAQNPDIYALSRVIGEEIIAYNYAPEPGGSEIERDQAVRALGMDYIRKNEAQFGPVMWRPVDRRENYVKRAVGLPGQLFELRKGVIYNDGVAMPQPKDAQFTYNIIWRNPSRADAILEQLGVSAEGRNFENGAPPLTDAMAAQLRRNPEVERVTRLDGMAATAQNPLFPLANSARRGWTLDNYGPLRIPAKGMTIALNDSTWAEYGHAISHYEPVQSAEWRNGQAYINGKPAKEYTFAMDYYFMMGDNRHRSLDSRFWGFVPEDHIVGRPENVLISFDPDGKGIRWSRILKSARK